MRMQEALAASSGAVVATAPDTAAANEVQRQGNGAFPSAAKAIIQCRSRSVVSGGRARANEWMLSFEPRTSSFIEPLMGWIGSSDPLPQIRLRFSSCEAAIQYAERQGLHYEIRVPAQSGPVIPSVPVEDTSIPEPIAWAWDMPHLIPNELEARNDNAGEPAHENRTNRATV